MLHFLIASLICGSSRIAAIIPLRCGTRCSTGKLLTMQSRTYLNGISLCRISLLKPPFILVLIRTIYLMYLEMSQLGWFLSTGFSMESTATKVHSSKGEKVSHRINSEDFYIPLTQTSNIADSNWGVTSTVRKKKLSIP